MSAPALTATEALLSQAAAQTPAEVHAARLALIAAAGTMCRELDHEQLLDGDGTAGNALLGGPRVRAGWVPRASCAIRSATLLRRAETRETGAEPW